MNHTHFSYSIGIAEQRTLPNVVVGLSSSAFSLLGSTCMYSDPRHTLDTRDTTDTTAVLGEAPRWLAVGCCCCWKVVIGLR